MKIEAIYDRGRLELPSTVRLRHERVSVIVEVPDDELLPEEMNEWPAELIRRSEDMLAELARIRHAPLPADEDLPELTEKQQKRIDAFALRARLRAEQGRPE